MFNYRAFLTLLFVFCTLQANSYLQLTPEEEAFLESHPTIRVSNEMDWPPFDFAIGGKPSGYSIDLLKLIEKKIGISFEFINGYTWAELWKMFENKDIDITHPVSITKERKDYGIYANRIYSGKYMFITKIDTPEINFIESLRDKVIASPKGWAQTDYLKRVYPHISLYITDDEAQARQAVKEGKAYATIGNDAVTYYALKKEMNRDLKINAPFTKYNNGRDNDILYLIRKDWPLFHQIFTKAYESITVEEIEELQNKWFGKEFKNLQEKESPNSQFSIKEQKYLQRKGAIKMCIDPNWMPFERLTKDNIHEGMVADILKLVQERTNLKLELVKTRDWLESLDYAKHSKCDIFSLAMPTSSRKKYMDFTTPYMSFSFVIATSTKELFVENIESLQGKKIAMLKGYAYTEILKEKYPEIQIEEVHDVKRGLQLVREDKVYGFADALPTIAYTIQQEGMTDIKITGKFDNKWELGIGTRNDEPLLRSIFKKALLTVSEEEKRSIYNSWFSVNSTKVVDYTLLKQILFVLFFIALGWIYWSRRVVNAKRETQFALNKLQDTQKLLEKMAITDKLTQVYNRNKLDDVLAYEINRVERFGESFGVIILDLDYFKKVNDTFGHQAGDEVLVDIAKILIANSRKIDIVGRWGGEEFLLICPQANLSGLEFLVTTIKKAIESHKFVQDISQTASFGLTLYKSKDSVDTLIERADKALYQAKKSGRNTMAVKLN